jgi:hypothetical protein
MDARRGPVAVMLPVNAINIIRCGWLAESAPVARPRHRRIVNVEHMRAGSCRSSDRSLPDRCNKARQSGRVSSRDSVGWLIRSAPASTRGGTGAITISVFDPASVLPAVAAIKKMPMRSRQSILGLSSLERAPGRSACKKPHIAESGLRAVAEELDC